MDRSEKILAAIRKSLEEKGFPPTVRELVTASGLKSTSSVHSYLKRLEEQGLIHRDRMLSRGIELADGSPRPHTVPLVGRVAAGQPVLAEENRLEDLPLPQSWARAGDFALTVRGDSMIGAGILDGDVAIVDPDSRTENGTIVVALVGDEATVKYLHKESDHVRLEPANDAYQPIIARDVTILGKVVGLYRRL